MFHVKHTGVEAGDAAAVDVARALLLNGEGAEAITILKDRPGTAGAVVFDLLCAQLKFREAFAYADKALKVMEKEEDGELLQRQLNVRRVIALATLGDADSATQLSRKLLDQLVANPETVGHVTVYVIEFIRANQRTIALEWLAKAAPALADRRGEPEDLLTVFDRVFADNGAVALAWWAALRKAEDDKDTAGQLRRIDRLLAGTGEKADIALINKQLTSAARDEVPRPGIWGEHSLQYALADLYRRHGDVKEADALYRKAIAPEPAKKSKDEEVNEALAGVEGRMLMGYADFLTKEGRHAEAAAMYGRAWKIEPDEGLPLFLQGHALVKAGDEKAGKARIEAAHWAPLGDEQTRARFCEELSKRGFEEDSRREMQIILDAGWFRSFEVGNMHLRMARRLARGKEYAKAAQFYEKDVVSLFRTGASFQEPRAYLTVPELARTFRLRAMVAAGKTDAALAEATRSLDVLPGNVELAIDFVPELEKAGRKTEADAMYARVRDAYAAAIKDFGSSADLRNSVAWVMVNCNRDLAEAKTHAEKAVALMPDAAGYIDTLAEVHFRLKDRPKALELMKKCAAMEPKNPYYRKQLERFEKRGFDSPTPDEETGED